MVAEECGILAAIENETRGGVNLGIPETELGLILINNGHALIEQRLVDGDTLTLFPLLGGGQ